MKSALLPLLSLAALLSPAPAKAADDPVLNQAYQDHIAYVATFALPVIMEKCAAIDPASVSYTHLDVYKRQPCCHPWRHTPAPAASG